jgi:TonB-dependent SusC/RagA subfamily outer membrane receptor
MKKVFFAAAMFVLCFQTAAFCQTNGAVITNAVSKLKTLITDHMIEKAYLQFDRPYASYVTGEVVYFKSYVTMGERHQPSTLSNVLHVDLINKDDVILRSIAVQLTNGTGWGDFPLSDTLQKGSYRIRAYTQWMRNDEHPYFFDQYISVGSANSVDRSATNTAQALKPDLQFFPEGGNMVADVPSKVAFKAIGTNGLGTSVKGIVVDNEHKEVAKIVTAHLGMGAFNFIPETGKTYKAMVTFGDGSQQTINLPAADAKGIALSVNTDDPSKISISIIANRPYFKENKDKQLNLLVYYSGAMKRYTPKLDGEVLGLDLPANAFPTGIVQVTLMSETGEPLNERLAFIQNPDLLNLSIASNKPAYAKRENVQLSFNAKNKDGNPATGSFSVSVVDESKILVDENTENTILSYLLLTTEVKGYIEKPNYYFANVTKETRAALDALMLTQGYRRFTWKQLMNDNSPATANTYTPEKQIDISGSLKTKSGEPIPNCQLTLVAKAGGSVSVQVTDAEGRFVFPNVQFETGAEFILKAQSSLGKKSVLKLDSPQPGPAVAPGNAIDAKYNTNADILASLQNNQGQGVMTASTGSGNLLVKGEKTISQKRSDSYRSSNLAGPGHADQVIMGDDIKNAPSLSIGLTGIAHGVQFSAGVPALITGKTVSGAMGGSENAEAMLVVVDGVEIGGDSNVDLYNPGSVETVEILKGANAAIYGMAGGQGVMVITTRQGGMTNQAISKEMSPGIFAIEPKGFYKAREFYSPNYSTTQTAANTADQRTTIFWKPDVTTDTGGNASFNFYNADSPGTYRVEIQGIDSNGNLGMQVFRYKVQ